MHYYSKGFPDLVLKETTFKDNYLLHINNSAGPTDLQELQHGRPLLIGEDLVEQVKQYITRNDPPINCLPHYPPLGHWVGMGRDLKTPVIKHPTLWAGEVIKSPPMTLVPHRDHVEI